MRRLAACLAALVAGGLCAGSALADGDPASDVLVVQNVFLPFQADLPKPLEAKLTSATAEAKRAGYPIRVALITQPSDLGAVPSLFGKPQTYARFLGQELTFVYRDRLLVVMPQGFGVYHGRASVAQEQRVLSGIAIGSGVEGMAGSAVNAVIALARSAGHRLSVEPVAVQVVAKKDSSGSDRLLIGGAVAGVVLLAGAAFVVRRWRRA
jgi:hypothetical protein